MITIQKKTVILFYLFAAVFSNLALESLAAPAGAAPANIGELKQQINEYKRSGEYDRGVAAVLKKAQAFLERRALKVRMPALVLDIDETSLSNWQQIQANDYGTRIDGPCNLPAGPCGLLTWQMSAKADVIAPTLALFNDAKARGVAIFFITGRDERVRAATEANLHIAGYEGWTDLIMRPPGTSTRSASDFKAPERAKIAAKGFTIIANIGDQPSDLSGGYAQRTFLVPDPFYRIP
jgi:acid phosphatase